MVTAKSASPNLPEIRLTVHGIAGSEMMEMCSN